MIPESCIPANSNLVNTLQRKPPESKGDSPFGGICVTLLVTLLLALYVFQIASNHRSRLYLIICSTTGVGMGSVGSSAAQIRSAGERDDRSPHLRSYFSEPHVVPVYWGCCYARTMNIHKRLRKTWSHTR